MTIEKRLETLERQLSGARRRYRAALGAAAVMVAGLALAAMWTKSAPAAATPAAAPAQEAIHAKGFILEDEAGRKRASLTMETGGPALRIYGEDGNIRAMLQSMNDTSELTLRDAKNVERAGLRAVSAGSGMLLKGDKGEIRAALTVIKDEPELGFSDGDNKMRATLHVATYGSMLNFLDENGKRNFGLASSQDQTGIALSDPSGKTRAVLGVSKGGPTLALFDDKGNNRAALGVLETTAQDGKTVLYPESSLLLMGADGKLLFPTPK